MTVFYTESFETDGNGTRYVTSVTEFTDGSGDFFTRTDGTNIGSFYEVSGQDGSFFFAGMDVNGEGAADSQTLTLSNIDISGYENLSLSLLVAEDDDGSNQDWDEDSELLIEVSIDGGEFQSLLEFQAVGGTNTEPALDTDGDGFGDTPTLTNTFATFSSGIAGVGSSMDVRISFNELEAGDEDAAIDLIEISGDLATTPPSGFTLELLHITDQEGSTAQLTDIVGASAVLNALEAEDLGGDGLPDNTIRLSAGDAIIPGVFFDASEAVFGSAGIADILIQNELGIQAIALGNHEFDGGTEELAGLIDGSATGVDQDGNDFTGTDFPYLSANLDFSTDANLAPLAVEGGQAPQGNVVTSSTVLSIPHNGPSMLDGEGGFAAVPIFTVGETFTGTTGALNSSTAGDYTPVGILDGIGAYELDADTVRVFVNHELGSSDGYAYDVSNGAGGTFTIDGGARVSYFDIDKTTKKITDSGLAFNTIYDQTGNIATDNTFAFEGGAGFNRFCSSVLIEAEQFGGGRGLVDRIYFAGEETGGVFSNIGGNEWALDVETGDFWALPDFGRGAWENVAEVDTGTTDKVAFVLMDDTAPFNITEAPDFSDSNDTRDENFIGAPMFMYVGTKSTDPSANFIERNGLDGGDLYVWVADGGALTPADFAGTGSSSGGSWVLIDNTPDISMASEDGSTGFDEFGYPTQRNLWSQAKDAGAFQFSRPEDVAVNPADGSEFVFASTGRSDFAGDSDLVGTIYTVDLGFDTSGAPISGTANILYDGDSDPSQALRSPDNLDWADDGLIYVNEDRAVGGLFGPGSVNPNDASIVSIDPATGDVTPRC